MTATINCAGCQHAYIATALFCPNCGRPKVQEVPADPLLGKVLGERFLVQELLGQGGSGTIYRAEHVTLRRRVAIKVLHNELSRDDLAVERFRREATTVAEIDNEHIVEIHDFGRTPDGRLYLAMELLEGETLDAVLVREKQLSIERAADILIQLGETLMEAHAIGYVHRDLRPRNIYLSVRRGKANFIKLLDFGLAKLVETEGQAASTSLGMTFGDPRYMSPEQARGDRIDRRADIYQLGCVAYEMLTGGPPFTGNRVFDILTKQVTEAPQPLPTRRPGTPLWMEAAVTKMLAKDPDNRFATTTRMVEALRQGLDTGEVMEADVARRRESVPPPSVSRVIQRMGLQTTTDAAAQASAAQASTAQASTAAGSTAAASAPAAAGSTTAAQASATAAQAPAAQAPAGQAPASAPSPAAMAGSSVSGISAVGAAAAIPAPSSSSAGIRAASDAVGAPARSEKIANDLAVTMRGAAPLPKPDSVELLRKRTGTPRIGVPLIDPVTGVQPPIAGVIEPVRAAIPSPASLAGSSPMAVAARDEDLSEPSSAESRMTAVRVRAPVLPDAPEPRGKRSSAADLHISQRWYDEGDQLSGDDEMAVTRRSRVSRPRSPSSTDLFYDERPRRRWGLVLGIGAVAVIGGTLAFALTRGRSTEHVVAQSAVEQPSATAPVAPAPSRIIAPEPPPETAATAAGAKDDLGKAANGKAAAIVRHPPDTRAPAANPPAPARQPVVPRQPPAAVASPGATSFPVPGSEPTRRPPGVELSAPSASPSGPTPPRRSTAPALTEGPRDPYATDDTSGDGAPPEKKAEFFANLGSQQLIGGDTAGAAANFKKAAELDSKNVAATSGLGEIALRQGLFGDAIAHLSKASKLAPRSPKVLTLLGEAYLNSGNNQQAAAQFKKALQIDPDNARARDGYNEASSRVPPPDDDAP